MRSKALFTALSTPALLASALLAQGPGTKPATHHSVPMKPSLLNPASLKAKAPENFEVRFATSAGEFTVAVHRAWAPIGADRFYNLVRHGFFTDCGFFRVVPGFVVQFGLSPTPAVSKVWEDAKISDDPVTQTNKRGYLTFATAGPNTRTTQLFISLVDNQRLDAMGFAPFGEVTKGMEAVDKITSKYGEAPQQDRISHEGKAYLQKEFPDLDVIRTTTIIPPATAPKPVVHHTAAHPATAHPAATHPAPAQ